MADSEKGYVLHQKSRDLGPITVSATQKALRIDFDEHKCSLICREPDWVVYLFRPDEKAIWAGNIYDVCPDKLGNLGRISDHSEAKPHRSIIISSVQKLIETKRLKVLKSGDFQGYLSQTLYYVDQKGAKEFQCLDDLQIDAHCAGIISNFCEMPVFDRMPVKVTSFHTGATQTYSQEHKRDKVITYSLANSFHNLDLRTGPQLLLQTTKIQKTQTAAHTFDVPKDYKLVGAPAEVMYSKDTRQKGMEMLIGQ